jgi:hypothetical protein
VFYAAEDFQLPWGGRALTAEEARQRFIEVLSRARPKDLAYDYLDREHTLSMAEIEAAQQRAAEHWREKQQAREPAQTNPAALRHEHTLALRGPEDDFDV